MTRKLPLLPGVLVLLSAAAAAQPHGAGWSFLDGGGSGAGRMVLGRVDLGGKITTILPASRLPSAAVTEGATLDGDDRTYLVTLALPTARGSLIRVDARGAVLETIQVCPKPPAQGGGTPVDVALDDQGRYVVLTGAGSNGGALLVVDRQRRVTTLLAGPLLIDPWSLLPDRNRGGFLILDAGGGAVLHVAADGSAVTSIGTFPGRGLRVQIARPAATGDLFAGATLGPLNYAVFRMDGLGAVTTFLPALPFAFTAAHADRSSAARPRLVFGSSAGQRLFFVDLTSRAVTTFASGRLAGTARRVFPPREVATLGQAAGRWDIRLHFAGEAGAGYAIALSLSGFRPGVPLPDGRRILLNPDPLTRLSLTGQIAPLLAGNLGVLDASGRATARLDVTSLPPLAGVPVWIQAVTVDPKAPLGLRTIADPVRLTVGRGAVARGWIGGGRDGWQTGSAPPAGGDLRSFNRPFHVALDRGGRLFVPDYLNHRVVAWDRQGRALGWIGGGKDGWQTGNAPPAGSDRRSFNLPRDVAVDPGGNLYVVDRNNHRVVKWDRTGKALGWIGGGKDGWQTGNAPPAGRDARSFSSPSGLCLDGRGNLLVADQFNHRVSRWSTGGLARGWIGGGRDGWQTGNAPAPGRGLRGFDFPSAVAVDRGGHVFVADMFNQRVCRWDASGRATGWIGGGKDGWQTGNAPAAGADPRSFRQPFGLCVAGNGDLHVADFANRRVSRWTAGGLARGWIGGGRDGWQTGNAPASGRGTRSFYLPRDVVADGFGNLYVVDGDRIAWWRG